MQILVSGASGLVGRAVVAHLKAAGHEVKSLVRRQAGATHEIFWDPIKGTLDAAAIDGCQAVIHLAGRPIAARWSPKIKQEIRDSRVLSTALLVKRFAELKNPPRVFLCASAIGFYGDRQEELLTEASPPGRGFLAETCQEWEQAAQQAASLGIRVVNLRFGHVIAREGGVLGKLLPVFQWGLGGPLSDGRAWWSWILRRDAVRAISFLMERDDLSGPFNLTSPHPVRNREFSVTLARILGRPCLFAVPKFALAVLYGEMAEEALFVSSRVLPARLQEAGFQHEFPLIDGALREAIQRGG